MFKNNKFIFSVFLFSLSVSTAAQPLFPFEQEIFTLNSNAVHTEEVASLGKLCKRAEERNNWFSSLYDFVKENKFTPASKKLFQSQIDAFRSFADVPEDLVLLQRVQSDYAVERDLSYFFYRCLSALIAPHYLKNNVNISELYNQTIYVVRKNIQSVWNDAFCCLNQKYPEDFGEKNGENFINLDAKLDDEESQHYRDFIVKFSAQGRAGIMIQNTLEVEEIAYYLLKKPHLINNPFIVFDLNTIVFYLEIEKMLLENFSHLHFDPNRYDFDSDNDVLSKDFILSALIEEHCKSALSHFIRSKKNDKKGHDRYMRLKEKLLSSCINNSTPPFVEIFFNKIYGQPDLIEEKPFVDKNKGGKPSHYKKKKNKNKKKIRKPKNVLRPAPVKEREDLVILPEPTEENFQLSYVEVLLKETEKVPQKKELLALKLHAKPAFSFAHIPVVNYSDYIYSRHMRRHEALNYTFQGNEYNFSPIVFKEDFLKEIKSKLSTSPDASTKINKTLPNLATYSFYLHYTIEGSNNYHAQQFVCPNLFLSGSCSFRKRQISFKSTHSIVNAYDDVLSTQEKENSNEYNPLERYVFIQDSVQKKIQENLVKKRDRWLNSLHSESLILLELVKTIPLYMFELLGITDKKITIHGLALGLFSYRECCPRCRNLSQGFQWGLSNLMKLILKDPVFESKIDVSEGFSSIVLASGQISCKTIDREILMHEEKTPSLEKSDSVSSRHKLIVVSLR